MENIYIDVSRYQGDINWDKLKGKIDGAFLKTVSTNSHFGGIYIDQYFEKNYSECKRLGIPVGVYYYTYARTIEVANKELAKFKEAITGKSFELPLVVDVEDNYLKPLSKEALTSLVKYQLEEIQKWNAYSMLYTYLNYSNVELDMKALSNFDTWLAAYTAIRPTSPKHNIWQYTSSGSLDGINGRVDMNKVYLDYPTIIKKANLNNFDDDNSKWISVCGKVITVIADNCEYFSDTNVYTNLGYLGYGTKYELLAETISPINNFNWGKIKKDGKIVYVAMLSDKISINSTNDDLEKKIIELEKENELLTNNYNSLVNNIKNFANNLKTI